MNFNRMLLLLLGVLAVSTTDAQQVCEYTFSGTIVSETGEPLPGAAVSIGPSRGTATDNQGRFILRDLCADSYTVTITYLGFETQTFRLTITGNVVQSIVMKSVVTELHEVVIRDHAKNTEHQHNFSFLTETQLAKSAGKTLGESLKALPGVSSIQSGPGIVKPVIHGVHSQRILILNHGIRQEGQQWGAEHAPEIDPFVASNMVVIKDASSIKYGTDALGGVIVINPPDLPEKNGLSGSMDAVLQSNGRSGVVSAMLEGGIPSRDGWGWRVQGTARRTGDYHAADYMLTNTGVKELDFSTALGYRNDRKSVEVFFSHFSSELGILKGTSIGNMEDLMNAMERTPPQYTADFSYQIAEPRQEVTHNLLKVNGKLHTSFGEWRAQYGFQNNMRREFDIRRGGLSQIPAIDLQLQTHTLESEWELESESENGGSTCVGVTGMYQRNDNIPGTQRIPFIPDYDNLSAGVFAIKSLTLNRILLDAGIRYDLRYYDVRGYDYSNTLYKTKTQFSNVSATLGATLPMSGHQSLGMSISTAWRPPHVAELYSLGTHQSAAAIEYGLLLNDSTNEVMDLDPSTFDAERAIKWVATYEKDWERVHMDVTGYVNYISDFIYLRPSGITQDVRGTYPYLRYAQTNALFVGADVNMLWTISPAWSVNPRATLLRVTDQSNDDYLVFIPSNRYEAIVSYRHPDVKSISQLYAEATIRYVDKQRRAPRTITPRDFNEAIESDTDPFGGSDDNFDFMDAPPAYTLLNVAIGFSIKTAATRYDFRLAAENLFNASYREYTNRFRYYADDLGRNFVLSVKCTF